MRSFKLLLGLIILILHSTFLVAQVGEKEKASLEKVKNNFAANLYKISNDTTLIVPISKYVKSKIDSIYYYIVRNKALPGADKEKAVRSLAYFLLQLRDDMGKQKTLLYDIPESFKIYYTILKNIINKKALIPEFRHAGAERAQLIATAFRTYPEFKVLNDIAVYKRVASTPKFVMNYVEFKPNFRFTDSLLILAAVSDPEKFLRYMSTGKPEVIARIKKMNNIYMKKIVEIQSDKNATELIPFVVQLTNKTITPDEIVATRLEPVKYFQLMVDKLIEQKTEKKKKYQFEGVLNMGIRAKALSFFINEVNGLHESGDDVRFASVKDLRPEDIYYIITNTEKEMYTSSYLGLYKRLMQKFKHGDADSVFKTVQNDNFRTFIRIAAAYNTLDDFLKNMPRERALFVLDRFISGVDTDISSGLERAMDIADSFITIAEDTTVSDMAKQVLDESLAHCKKKKLYFGNRIYTILLQVFELARHNAASDPLWSKLGSYDELKRDALLSKNNEIVQLVLFYGDEDGIASYQSFMSLFRDGGTWTTTKTENWIKIQSKTDQPIVIYANLPLDHKNEKDLAAQDSLQAYLEKESIEPTILVHRGHSYHLSHTLSKLVPSVKLAILGSCGGYNHILSVSTINPDAQLIVTRQTGSKLINDPIIQEVNSRLLNNQDLSWTDIWDKLSKRFNKAEVTQNLFNEYVPPSRNVSLFVLKLFNYYKKAA